MELPDEPARLGKKQERVAITNLEHVTRTPWFTSQNEYATEIGNRLSGTHVDTWAVDNNNMFEETLAPTYYYPSACNLVGLTKHVSGNTAVHP